MWELFFIQNKIKHAFIEIMIENFKSTTWNDNEKNTQITKNSGYKNHFDIINCINYHLLLFSSIPMPNQCYHCKIILIPTEKDYEFVYHNVFFIRIIIQVTAKIDIIILFISVKGFTLYPIHLNGLYLLWVFKIYVPYGMKALLITIFYLF